MSDTKTRSSPVRRSTMRPPQTTAWDRRDELWSRSYGNRPLYPPARRRVPVRRPSSERPSSHRNGEPTKEQATSNNHLLLSVLIIAAILLGSAMFGISLVSTSSSSSLPSDTTKAVQGTWNVPCNTKPSAASGGYSVIGRPTISVDFIQKVLNNYSSPAADQAQALYNASLRCGIDPAFTLAFFMHESSFGKTGMATVTLSPGNLRCIQGFGCNSGYAQFDTWEDGFTVYCRLIRNLYVDGWGLITVDQIIPRYAPPSDNNDDWAYIHAVESAVDRARAGKVDIANIAA